MAEAEEQKRHSAATTYVGLAEAPPEPAEYEETVRIWRAGERARVEHHGGEQDGYYAVRDGPLWRMWDKRLGARSRPARWPQAQVELEREGTFVHPMSDNLTRDQLLTIAASLRPAPSTSSIEP